MWWGDRDNLSICLAIEWLPKIFQTVTVRHNVRSVHNGVVDTQNPVHSYKV